MNQRKPFYSKSDNRKTNENTRQVSEDIRKLVLARVQAMPSHLRLAIGSSEYTRDDLLNHVKKGDTVGQQVADIQMNFLRSLASGSIYDYNKKGTLTLPKDAQPKNPRHTPQP